MIAFAVTYEPPFTRFTDESTVDKDFESTCKFLASGGRLCKDKAGI